jgi:hypothetical protein
MIRRKLQPARLGPGEQSPTDAAPALVGIDEAGGLVPALAVVAVVPLDPGIADELVAAAREDQVRRWVAVVEVAVEREHPVERVPVDLAVDPPDGVGDAPHLRHLGLDVDGRVEPNAVVAVGGRRRRSPPHRSCSGCHRHPSVPYFAFMCFVTDLPINFHLRRSSARASASTRRS